MRKSGGSEQILRIDGRLVPESDLTPREREILDQGWQLGRFSDHVYDASHFAVACIAGGAGLMIGLLVRLTL